MSQSSDYDPLHLSSQLSLLDATDSSEFMNRAQLQSQTSLFDGDHSRQKDVIEIKVNPDIWAPFSHCLHNECPSSLPTTPTKPSLSRVAPTQIISPSSSASSVAPTEIMTPSASSLAKAEIISPSAPSVATTEIMSPSQSSESIPKIQEISDTVNENECKLEIRYKDCLDESEITGLTRTAAAMVDIGNDDNARDTNKNELSRTIIEDVDDDDHNVTYIEGMDAFDSLRDSQGLLSPGQLPNTENTEASQGDYLLPKTEDQNSDSGDINQDKYIIYNNLSQELRNNIH